MVRGQSCESCGSSERADHLVLGLAQKLLLAEIVDAERLAYTSDESTLESDERSRYIVGLGLVQQLQRSSVLENLVRREVASLARPRSESGILR